jgi:chloramphenicol O-acetyltransferase type A
MNTWSRKEQFHFFRQMDYPHFNLCANLDLTTTQTWLKAQGISFFKAMIYIAMTAVNDLPEFRYRVRGETVVEHELVHPSFTIMRNDGVFTFCPVEYTRNFAAFYADAGRLIEQRKACFDLADEPDRDDRVFITSIPWVSFTSMIHPIHMNPVDSIPRITWGKYWEDHGRTLLPLSVQVNHTLMDGQHVGIYFSKIQEILDHPELHLQR